MTRRPSAGKAGDHGLALSLDDTDTFAISMEQLQWYAMQQLGIAKSCPSPMTPKTVCNVLRKTGLKLEAVVVPKRSRSRIEAVMIVSEADGHREAFSVNAVAGIAVAFTARRPVLVGEALARKLRVTGDAGLIPTA